MKYYWSWAISQDRLESMGATGCIIAYYAYTKLNQDNSNKLKPDFENHLAFQANDGFINFVFLTTGIRIVELPDTAYHTLANGGEAEIPWDSKLRRDINLSVY